MNKNETKYSRWKYKFTYILFIILGKIHGTIYISSTGVSQCGTKQ